MTHVTPESCFIEFRNCASAANIRICHSNSLVTVLSAIVWLSLQGAVFQTKFQLQFFPLSASELAALGIKIDSTLIRFLRENGATAHFAWSQLPTQRKYDTCREDIERHFLSFQRSIVWYIRIRPTLRVSPRAHHNTSEHKRQIDKSEKSNYLLKAWFARILCQAKFLTSKNCIPFKPLKFSWSMWEDTKRHSISTADISFVHALRSSPLERRLRTFPFLCNFVTFWVFNAGLRFLLRNELFAVLLWYCLLFEDSCSTFSTLSHVVLAASPLAAASHWSITNYANQIWHYHFAAHNVFDFVEFDQASRRLRRSQYYITHIKTSRFRIYCKGVCKKALSRVQMQNVAHFRYFHVARFLIP